MDDNSAGGREAGEEIEEEQLATGNGWIESGWRRFFCEHIGFCILHSHSLPLLVRSTMRLIMLLFSKQFSEGVEIDMCPHQYSECRVDDGKPVPHSIATNHHVCAILFAFSLNGRAHSQPAIRRLCSCEHECKWLIEWLCSGNCCVALGNTL